MRFSSYCSFNSRTTFCNFFKTSSLQACKKAKSFQVAKLKKKIAHSTITNVCSTHVDFEFHF